MNREICIITGTRAEYGLLNTLMEEIDSDPHLELKIIATGSHLAPEFGNTYQEIVNDGFEIEKKIDILLASNSKTSISKSIGLANICFAEAFEEMKSDVVVLLGDRFEIMAAAISAFVARIPIAHIHGGELTEGVLDDAFRHSITKMSSLHFTSTESYRRRVIQLGEIPDRVYNVGALGVDNIRRIRLLSREELKNEIDFPFDKPYLIVTYHPETLRNGNISSSFRELLSALSEFDQFSVLFTYANADTGGKMLNRMIEYYIDTNAQRCNAFPSLGRKIYLSALKNAAAVVGNSSSGIIEAPSLKVPTVNVGNRQKGREHAESIIDCGTKKTDIVEAIKWAVSEDTKMKIKNIKNPYEKENTAKSIKEIIKSTDLDQLMWKKFYDIQF